MVWVRGCNFKLKVSVRFRFTVKVRMKLWYGLGLELGGDYRLRVIVRFSKWLSFHLSPCKGEG